MPALTSSMWAPAWTWAIVSRSTRLKSPAFISSMRIFRPVGLIRSPMMTNGRSSPMTTSRLAELTTVRVIRRSRSFGRRPAWCLVVGRCQGRPALDATRLDELGQMMLVVGRFEALDLRGDLGLEIVAAGAGGLAPFLDVVG